MNVLVTGGAGYIGSHTCKCLAAAGHLPVVYDDLRGGRRSAVRWGPLVEGDLLDGERLAAALSTHRIDAVVHFAALAAVGESIRRPDLYYRVNVVGTLTLLAAMRRTGVTRLVFSSSCATYGEPQALPLREDHPLAPLSPYGASKQMGERLLQDHAEAFDLQAVSLRYFNAAGADPDGELGESREVETHLVPLALRAQRGGGPLVVYGNDYPTPDGTCVRDYVHVCDLAQAHRQALECLPTGRLRPAYNLGCGAGFSVAQVLEAVAEVTGAPVPQRLGPRRPGDPPSLVADASAARAELQWRPQQSGLHDIVRSAWRWSQSGGAAGA